MSISIVRAEVRSDPQGRGYANMTAAQVKADLELPRIAITRPVDDAGLNAWAMAGGRHAKFRQAAAAAGAFSGLSATAQSLAIGAEYMLRRDGASYDPANPEHVALLGGLVAEGIIDSADAAALNARSTQTISRAEQLGMRVVRIGWCERALAGLGG